MKLKIKKGKKEYKKILGLNIKFDTITYVDEKSWVKAETMEDVEVYALSGGRWVLISEKEEEKMETFDPYKMK